jgi:transposase
MEVREMKARIPKRVYTEQFRDAAVRQVIEASRSVSEVARSLEISEKTLGNWVRQVRRGERPVKQAAAVRVNEAQAELSRLRQYVASARSLPRPPSARTGPPTHRRSCRTNCAPSGSSWSPSTCP